MQLIVPFFTTIKVESTQYFLIFDFSLEFEIPCKSLVSLRNFAIISHNFAPTI